jgi:hypothetical protein
VRIYITIFVGESAEQAVPVVSSADPVVVKAAVEAIIRRLSKATGNA